MTAFIIFSKESTHDQREIDIYQSQVRTTFTGHPIKVVAAGVPQILEGREAEGIVIIEFPTIEAAREWYDSAAYQAIIKHRFNGAKYTVVLIEA